MINSIERDQNCSTSPSPLILRAFYATSIFVRDYNEVYVVLVPIKLNSTAVLSGIKVYRLRLNLKKKNTRNSNLKVNCFWCQWGGGF